jgi:putative transposase
MSKDSTTAAVADGLFAGAAWFDPIEAGLRGRIRGFIEAMLEGTAWRLGVRALRR